MGKEQELLEAARSGNLSVVERILSQRAKKSGPLASLRRGPGANTQDQSGYTSLHHSALNGHKDIVTLLLAHEASTNVVDHKGSTPLHLAAWTGNTEIVKLLLVHGPSQPNVNLTNHDHETALHSAAQYGHTDVVALLLQHNSDPSIRNNKGESALDLAAQYGRLEAVELLIKTHPELLTDLLRTHAPLHLASRNGHKQVVKLLLDHGFDINFLTETGTALHEAALYGKIEVVKLLLDYGIDVNLQDDHKASVFDLLDDLNTNIAKQTSKIIREHMTLVTTDDEVTSSPCSLSPPPGFQSGSYVNMLIPDRVGSPNRQMSSPSSEINFYEVPPLPKALTTGKRPSGQNDFCSSQTPSKSLESSLDQSSSSSRSPSLYETPPPPRETEAGHQGSGSRDARLPSFRMRCSDPEAMLYEVPPPPTPSDSGKRFSDPLQQGSSYANTPYQRSEEDSRSESRLITNWSSFGSYIPMVPIQVSSNKPQPPAKPPRKSISPVNRSQPLSRYGSGYEYLSLASSGKQQHHDSMSALGDEYMMSRREGQSEYVDMKLRASLAGNYENHDILLASLQQPNEPVNVDQDGSARTSENGSCIAESAFSALYDEIASGRVAANFGNSNRHAGWKSTPALHPSSTGRPHSEFLASTSGSGTSNGEPRDNSKPNSLDFRTKRATVQIPLSPTNYQQPPTPDFPPPSPATAESGIHEKIRPLSQDEDSSGDDESTLEYRSRRSSRDIETLTDDELFATIDSSGNVKLSLRTENKSVSTDNIEEIVEDDPFAGLCRGSTTCADYCQGPTNLKPPIIAPKPAPRRPRNVYENVDMDGKSGKIILSSDKTDHRRSGSSLSVMSPFDENAEWAEIADIMASFGSGIARESVFAREMEERFASVLTAETSKSYGDKRFASVEEWLDALNLSEYVNLFIINGFDDINFLGGGILEDQELIEIGVCNSEHREKILESVKNLPAIRPIGKGEGRAGKPRSVAEWLKSLRLDDYHETFKRNGFTDMERVLKLWEVELNTVLEITKLGHRKRILVSLGDRSADRYLDLDDLDLSKLNLNLSELGIDDVPLPASTGKQNMANSVSDEAATPSTPGSAVFSESGSEGLKIRPPAQLMSEPGSTEAKSPQQRMFGGTPAVMNAQWRHQAETLISGCCDYTAKYLGSTLVKELKGMESTRKSILKLKTSTRDIAKIPSIILSISYTGVKFIDAQTKQLVCEHEIRNIHCACQDADDLNHFAYITKEHQTNNHYCHVFCGQSMDLATEIILTLGQAFEVAYQMALREKGLKTSPNTEQQPKIMERSQLEEKRYLSQADVQLVNRASSGSGASGGNVPIERQQVPSS